MWCTCETRPERSDQTSLLWAAMCPCPSSSGVLQCPFQAHIIILTVLDMRDDIQPSLEKEEKAWNHHDVKGILDGMTDDAICMLPGMDVAKGKKGNLIIILSAI